MSYALNDDDAAYEAGPCCHCGNETGVWDEDHKDWLHEFCRGDYDAARMASRVDAAHDAARDDDLLDSL